MGERKEKVASVLKKIASSFIQKNSINGVLVTVTKVTVSDDLKNSTVFINVFPEDREKKTLEDLKKMEKELRWYAKSHLSMKFLPSFEFEIDCGTKNEQRINELLGKV